MDRSGPEQLDVLRFDALMHSAGEHLAGGRNAEASTTLRAALALWRCIYVHCRAGIGRTGLVVGCFLAEEEGGNGKAALKLLNRLWRQSERAKNWPKVPQTAEQADYIRKWPKLGKRAP